MKKLLIPIAIVVIAVMAGGGWYVFGRHTDPIKNARFLAAKGDTRGAQIELRNAIKQNPGAPEPHFRLAQLQMALNDPIAAEKEIKEARSLKYDPKVLESLLAQSYLAQQRYADLLSEIKPDMSDPTGASRVLALRAVAQVGLADYPAARASVDEAERLAPDSLDALMTSARISVIEKDVPGAEKAVDRALDMNPKRADALLLKGQLQGSKGDKAGALEYIEKAVEASPNSSGIRLERANQYTSMGQDAKARQDVDQVVAAEPRNASAIYLDMVLLVRAGRYADADLALEKLSPVLNAFPRGLYFQALIKSNLGQMEQAVDSAMRYVARVPDDQDGVRLLAQIELGAHRPERAIAALTRSVGAGVADAETLDLLGRTYASQGKMLEASNLFLTASNMAPTNSEILTHLASTRMQLGDGLGATAALEKSLDIKPGQQNAGEALVVAALSAGDGDKAQAALDRLRQQIGNTEAVGVLAGMVRIAKSDLEGARTQFAATAQQFPASSPARVNLAKVLLLMNRRPEAEATLEEVLAKNRADPEALATLVQAKLQENLTGEAISAVEAAVRAAPTSQPMAAALVDLHLRAKENKKAMAVLQPWRDQGPLPPVLLAAYGRVQVADGDLAGAKATYTQILAATPTNLEIRRILVELSLNSGDLTGAKELLREGLRLSPGNLGIMSTLIFTEQRAAGLPAALALADELRSDPTNMPASTVIKGDAYLAAKRYTDAVATFSAELKVNPSTALVIRTAAALSASGGQDQAAQQLRTWLSTNVDDAEAAQMLASLDITARRLPEAEQNLGIVLSKRPNDAVALNNLAWVYQQKGDARARSLAQRAYLLSPTGESADTLGWILASEGQAEQAIPLLRRAVLQRGTDKAIRFHLASALAATGKTEEAAQILTAILADPGDFSERGAAQTLLTKVKAAK